MKSSFVVYLFLHHVYNGIHTQKMPASMRRVCYYTNWSQYRHGVGKFVPEDIAHGLCTHIVYAFASMRDGHLAAFEWNDESTEWMEGMFSRVNKLKASQAGLKVLLGVGGWNFGTKRMTEMLRTPTTRGKFIRSSITFLRERQFDGLDLDFEYPASRGSPADDKRKYAELVKEMQHAFGVERRASGKAKLLLTAAVAAGKSKIDKGYDVPNIARTLDFINLMSYDFHGKWEKKTGMNSPLFAHSSDRGNDKFLNLAFAANYWVQLGAPRSSINVGLPLYGRTFTLSNRSENGVGAKVRSGGKAGKFTSEAGYLAYYEICTLLAGGGATAHWLADQLVPYAVVGDQWIGHDNERSLKIKVKWIKEQGFGGVMVWALDLDDFSGTCGGGKYPLLRSIYTALTGERDEEQYGRVTNISRRSHHSVDLQKGKLTPSVGHRPTVTKKHEALEAMHRQLPPKPIIHNGFNRQVRVGICSGRPDGRYGHPVFCDRYYSCIGGVTEERLCVGAAIFSLSREACVPSSGPPRCLLWRYYARVPNHVIAPAHRALSRQPFFRYRPRSQHQTHVNQITARVNITGSKPSKRHSKTKTDADNSTTKRHPRPSQPPRTPRRRGFQYHIFFPYMPKTMHQSNPMLTQDDVLMFSYLVNKLGTTPLS